MLANQSRDSSASSQHLLLPSSSLDVPLVHSPNSVKAPNLERPCLLAKFSARLSLSESRLTSTARKASSNRTTPSTTSPLSNNSARCTPGSSPQLVKGVIHSSDTRLSSRSAMLAIVDSVSSFEVLKRITSKGALGGASA